MVPWDVLGWGVFATFTAAALVWWTGMGWTAAGLVAATGLVSIVLIVVLATLASGRPVEPGEPPHRHDGDSRP